MENPTLIQLPREVLEEILLHIPSESFPNIWTVSSLFHTFCNDEVFWKKKVGQDFPTPIRKASLPEYVNNYRELYARLVGGRIKYFPIIYDAQSYPSDIGDGVWLTKDMDVKTVHNILAKQGDNNADDYRIFGVSEYNLYVPRWTSRSEPDAFLSIGAGDGSRVSLSVIFADVTYWHISLHCYTRFKMVKEETWISDLWLASSLSVGAFLVVITRRYPKIRTLSLGGYDYSKFTLVIPGNPVSKRAGVSNHVVWLLYNIALGKELDEQENLLKISNQNKVGWFAFFVVGFDDSES